MQGAVLITRPSPAAELFRTTLALHGIAALCAPSLTYQPLDTPMPQGQWSGAIFTSAAAVRFLNLALLPAGWQARPCYCVGAATAETARAYGWRYPRQGGGDGTALAALIAAEQPADGRWLHPCGQQRQPEPAASLRAAGYEIAPWVVYRAAAAERLPAATVQAMQAQRLAVATFFSARTAQIFVDLARAAGLTESCRAVTALCLSPAIAAVAAALPWRDCLSTPQPTEAAFLSSLQNLLRR